MYMLHPRAMPFQPPLVSVTRHKHACSQMNKTANLRCASNTMSQCCRNTSCKTFSLIVLPQHRGMHEGKQSQQNKWRMHHHRPCTGLIRQHSYHLQAIVGGRNNIAFTDSVSGADAPAQTCTMLLRLMYNNTPCNRSSRF